MSLQYRYSLLIIILYATQLLYCNGDCSFKPDGSNYTYDFGELQKMGKQSTGDKDNSDISYEFMICGNLSSECDVTPNSGKGSIQQFTDGSCTEWLGSWDTGDEVSPLNDTNPDAGIIISWGQGTNYKSFIIM